ncbi:hypothetical protein TNIN_43851 [Trichonephila inaurata madagascariensis]|uniref:Uncharacterized protein n=1 Tax=Trichonephila inaurata madagascariensis TaxID=2747483 RepID=A0A8X6WRV6_9ARAC|nr:hypothetical protein TNIN_43851 [Trichonephila inaurata madagascariensis]
MPTPKACKMINITAANSLGGEGSICSGNRSAEEHADAVQRMRLRGTLTPNRVLWDILKSLQKMTNAEDERSCLLDSERSILGKRRFPESHLLRRNIQRSINGEMAEGTFICLN